MKASIDTMVAAVLAEAHKRYDESHGWQVIEECMSVADVAYMIRGCRTVSGALRKAREFAQLRTDLYNDVAKEVF